MGIGIDHIVWQRQTRRVAAVLTLAACMTSSSWARAPGPYFASLQSGNAAAFDNVPVLMIRMYLNTALATYVKACPEAAPSYKRPWDLAAYVMKVPPQQGGPNLALLPFLALEAKKMEAWTAGPGNAENDVLRFMEQSTCNAAAQRAWADNIKAFAQDPRIAGPFPQAQALCEESGASASLCACFAMSYDMEATPAERRRVLEGQPSIEGMRATLRNDYLSARVTYKCEASPPITSPDTEYLQTSDEQHRLHEGIYRMHFPLARTPSTATCTLSRQRAWLYALNCSSLVGASRLSNSGDTLWVHYRGSKPDELYRLLADGTLRLQSKNPRVALDLIPGAVGADTSQAQGSGAAAGGGRAPNTAYPSAARRSTATPEQCAKMLSDVQRIRSKATSNPRVIESIESRYAQYCSR